MENQGKVVPRLLIGLNPDPDPSLSVPKLALSLSLPRGDCTRDARRGQPESRARGDHQEDGLRPQEFQCHL